MRPDWFFMLQIALSAIGRWLILCFRFYFRHAAITIPATVGLVFGILLAGFVQQSMGVLGQGAWWIKPLTVAITIVFTFYMAKEIREVLGK